MKIPAFLWVFSLSSFAVLLFFQQFSTLRVEAGLAVSVLANNNTGPKDLSRPVWLCFPKLSGEQFPKCICAGGLTFRNSFFPELFHAKIWKMNLDLATKTVEWEELEFDNPPIEAVGGFHQYWVKNATAFSFTGALNDFVLPNNATCHGGRIVTYDYVSQMSEATTPNGPAGGWGPILGGGCDRFRDDVYCYGAFNCTSLTDVGFPFWSKYNIPTNTLSFPASTGLSGMLPRHHASVTGILGEEIVVIGAGDKAGGGTFDQWSFYNVDSDSFEFFEPTNKPVGIQYLSPDVAQVWNVSANGSLTIVKDAKKMLLIGGDKSSGAGGSSNTQRYVGLFRVNNQSFKEFDAECDGLWTEKQARLASLPVLATDPTPLQCSYFLEFGGYEQNAKIPFPVYHNGVVLYSLCNNSD